MSANKIEMTQINLSEFQRKLIYEFKNVDLLVESLRHSSFVNEHPEMDIQDNERLEFLGDAVLNLVVGHILMQRYPDLKEGDLSRMRANLVNESQLASIARKMDLGSHILLGKGEVQSKGREKKSILANTYEAVIAAVYLDGGFDAVFRIIDGAFSSLMDFVARPSANHDYKSQIQELVQLKYQKIPDYTVVHESGPDHDKTLSRMRPGKALKFYSLMIDRVSNHRPFIIPIFLPHAGCPHQCIFCNQTAITGVKQSIVSSETVDLLIDEFLEYKRPYRRPAQVAFYGGNFLGLKKDAIRRLLDHTMRSVTNGRIDSIRFSTRPETIDQEHLEIISDYPVSTVEIGVQSMDDRVLAMAKRGHTAADTVTAVKLLKERGYTIG
ncbi:MAG: ribonuclease III, partial [Deltaproteobacteria bacterium]|nr:ribonuclease III [Deltaproteobacteria bacterium]